MTTSPTPPDRARPIDRLVNYVLDVDGDIYGDERERIRWYEGISLAASFQWLAVPWAMAVLVWFADRSTVPFLVAVLTVFYVPILLTTAYVRRKGVRLLPERRNAKYWLITALGGVPYLVFVLGAIAVHDPASSDDGSSWGALVGGVVGGALGLLGLAYAERRRRRREDAAQDGE
jgi:MYXO-CTERM domain-containing protein